MSFHDELQLATSSKGVGISREQFVKTRRKSIERLFGYRFYEEDNDEVAFMLADIEEAANQVYGAQMLSK